jgi:hypothetical protein
MYAKQVIISLSQILALESSFFIKLNQGILCVINKKKWRVCCSYQNQLLPGTTSTTFALSSTYYAFWFCFHTSVISQWYADVLSKLVGSQMHVLLANPNREGKVKRFCTTFYFYFLFFFFPKMSPIKLFCYVYAECSCRPWMTISILSTKNDINDIQPSGMMDKITVNIECGQKWQSNSFLLPRNWKRETTNLSDSR